MTIRVQILGEGEAVALARRLARAGDRRFRDHLQDHVNDSNRGIQGLVRASALSHLPKRNGLAGEIARGARITVNEFKGATPGFSVRASHKYDLDGLDKGGNVHPLFGNKRHWYFQRVRSGWFSDAMEDQADRTHAAIERAVATFDV